MNVMYWRRNLQALILQGILLVILLVFCRNPCVAIVCTLGMAYAVFHATTRDGEIVEWLTDALCFVLLSRPVLAIVAGIYWVGRRMAGGGWR